jgi:hypothetical protein
MTNIGLMGAQMGEENLLDLSGGVGPLFSGAESLLKFGPIGLSALLLVLGAIVFVARNFSDTQARLVRQFMWLGGVLSIVFAVLAFLPTTMAKSVHDVHLSVQPLDLDAYKDFPKPTLSVNNQRYDPPLDIKVGQEVTAILDVSAALALMQSTKSRLEALTTENADLKAAIRSALTPAVVSLSEARDMTTRNAGASEPLILQRLDFVAARISASIDRVE